MMKFFTSDIRRNIIKILCLTVGLALGFLLIAKVYFEGTYDTWCDGADRIYILTESATQNGEYKEYFQTPGAIAPGFKQYCPQVESATRLTYTMQGQETLRLEDGRMFSFTNAAMADSSFFDVFSTRIIEGDPHEVLEVPFQVMIPHSLAAQIGMPVKGMEFTIPSAWPGVKFTIGGVYEDFPLNSSIENMPLLSLSTIAKISYDGRDNWIGNDRYISFVKLTPGSEAADMKPNIDRMMEENLTQEAREVYGLGFGMKPLIGHHSAQPETRTMMWILGALGVIILMCAALNYLLVVLGQMGKRGKEMAIRKCYGTSNLKLFTRVMGESLFFLIISLGLSILLIFCFKNQCAELLDYTPQQLFSTGRVWMVQCAVIILLAAITGALPAWIYCKTPVSDAFRTKGRSRKGWKLALLSLQFFASGLLICILSLVVRQYSLMSSLPMGYEYEDVAHLDLSGVAQDVRRTLKAELEKLAEVRGVASASQSPVFMGSGNNVWREERPENQFNIQDMYDTDPRLMEVLGMKFVQGGTFSESSDSTKFEIVVDARFIEALQKYYDVKSDNIIGEQVYITEHTGILGMEPFTVVGVVEAMRRNGLSKDSEDTRPTVFFPSSDVNHILYIRFSHLNDESLKKAQNIVSSIITDREIYISPMKNEVSILTEPMKKTGASVMLVGIVIIVIALIGLIGYVSDEVAQRAKEVAVRRVTGYRSGQIVKLFCIDTLRVALPSLIAGGAVAILVGRHWLSQFSDAVSLSPLGMIACLVGLAVLIVGVVVLNSWHIANSNPVEHLRNE